ncbi:flagellar basal body rod protein FlgC [Candidatus Bodocaedibacter vickermanii]|uniref:Flagellar basal body rod protein FlgC n=1 Tax=Candidatus Bodocaedibacter vickermanii TaxID=2741701 RepID=A0A7L9RT75_9PROT|nr:flagellar basal body rod protein FlgC [Candidatus Paracaedibacteraceae bacterium 'Lake Konstanz']
MPRSINFSIGAGRRSSHDDLHRSLKTSASGLNLNKFMLRLTAENISHADTLASTPGADAYRAKLPIVGHSIDPETGAMIVNIQKVVEDPEKQSMEYYPDHPGADKKGMVKKTNVNDLVEKLHLAKYQKGANANLQAYQVALKMRRREIEELLK